MGAATDFTRAGLMRQLVILSFTSSIGIVAIYFVDLMDIFFISLLGHNEMAAAASYAGTVMFFISSVNIGISVASGALTAQYLGAGRTQDARDVTAAATIIAAMVAAVMSIAMFPFFPDFVAALGAEGVVADLAITYLKIVVPSSFLSGMSMALVASMRGFGIIKWAMYPALLGAMVNLLFDPLLIFVFELQLAGAAWATVLARIATFVLAAYGAVRLFETTSRPDTGTLARHRRKIGAYALPAVLSSVAGPIGLAIITRHFAPYGAEAVAGVAVIGRISPVAFAVISGMTSVIGPMIGQNHSAGLHDRARQAYFNGIRFLAVYCAILIAILVVFRNPIADVFGAQGLARDLILLFCGPFAIIGFFNGMIFASSAAFSHLGHPRLAPRLNWAKNTIGLLPCLVAGSYLFGVYGMAYGILLNAAVFAGVGHFLTLKVMNAQTTAPAPPVGDGFEETRHVSIEHNNPTFT